MRTCVRTKETYVGPNYSLCLSPPSPLHGRICGDVVTSVVSEECIKWSRDEAEVVSWSSVTGRWTERDKIVFIQQVCTTKTADLPVAKKSQSQIHSFQSKWIHQVFTETDCSHQDFGMGTTMVCKVIDPSGGGGGTGERDQVLTFWLFHPLQWMTPLSSARGWEVLDQPTYRQNTQTHFRVIHMRTHTHNLTSGINESSPVFLNTSIVQDTTSARQRTPCSNTSPTCSRQQGRTKASCKRPSHHQLYILTISSHINNCFTLHFSSVISTLSLLFVPTPTFRPSPSFPLLFWLHLCCPSFSSCLLSVLHCLVPPLSDSPHKLVHSHGEGKALEQLLNVLDCVTLD